MKTMIRAALLAAAATTLLTGAAFAAPAPRFVVPTMSSTGGTLPRDLEAADFNRDGRTDVAVANLGPDVFNGGVAVLLGDGSGNLGPPIDTSLGPQSGADDLAVADFDGDGIADVAALEATTGGYGPIFVLLGNGDGTFAIAGQLPNGAEGQLATTDLDRDGNADLVFSDRKLGDVRVYLGDGTGGFGAPDTYASSGTWDIALGDVNRDGFPDLVGATGGSPVTMLGQPGGRLGPEIQDFLPDLMGWKLTLGDFNGNGNLDVALVDASGGHLSVGLGLGDGHFTPRVQYGDVARQTSAVASGDFTGDGRKDVVVNNGENVSVLFQGRGDGTFSKQTYWVTGDMGFVPARLNGDARMDLVAWSQDPGTVYATLSGRKGKLRAPQNTLTRFAGVAAEGDLDGDGRLDVVLGGQRFVDGQLKSTLVAHLKGRGTSKFGPPVETVGIPLEIMSGIAAVELADVNGDGRLDALAGLVHLYAHSENVLVALGKGDGTFGAPTILRTGDAYTDITSLAVVDVTGDGKLDVIAYTRLELAVFPGNGNGTFGAPLLSGSSDFNQNATLVADFTGDGVLDVAAVFKTGGEDAGIGEIRLERGNGDGTFTLVQTLTVDSNLLDGEVADLNSDGRPDVAATGARGSNFGRNGLYVALNAGGTLAVPVYYPVGCGRMTAADLNLDGTVDIATECYFFAVSLNPGDGTFDQRVSLPSVRQDPLAADFTGDGKPDLLGVLSTNKPQLTLYLNETPL